MPEIFGALTPNSSNNGTQVGAALGVNPLPRPVEFGIRVVAVDGGYYIQNFDPSAGNVVRTTLDEVQTYLNAMVANKFAVAETSNSDAQINEVGVEVPQGTQESATGPTA